MRRRDFLFVVGNAAVAWPWAGHAQQAGDLRHVAYLHALLAKDDQRAQRGFTAFKTGMKKLGWIEGKNVRYESDWGWYSNDRFPELAKEVVRQTPDVIYVVGTPLTVALRRETKSLPIVFALTSDPVGDGLVKSWAHPGGNVTGFSALYPEIVGKWLQILKEIAPRTKRAALLFNPRTAPFMDSGDLRRLFETAARQIEVAPIMAPVHDAGEIKAAIDSLARTQGGGLVVMADAFVAFNRALIIETVASHNLPAIYPFDFQAIQGGLVAYGADVFDIHRRSADYVDRILKGEKPANLPIQAPTKFELIINLKTAKALGLTVLPTLLARAHKVIE
jgi:putative ABC transport system substrate-binding protein